MNDFLELSVWKGLMTLIIGISVPGLIMVFFVRNLIRDKIKKQHERVGRLMFRVTASLLALLISLSYANEKVNYNKVVDSLEDEASLIAGVLLKLRIHNSPLANEVRNGLIEYVEFTINDGWKDVVNNPYQSKMWGKIVYINFIVRELAEDTPKQVNLKSEIISDIGMITKTIQVRFYSTYFHLPYLTYILFFGLLIVWSFFSVYELDTVSLSFLTLYNIFITVLLYFVIMLGNPMVGPLKIAPDSFTVLRDMGLEKLPF
jgi:hypothetical protein